MPFRDGTGPQGRGPMTGRGFGNCAGYGARGPMNRGFGRGFGGPRRGFGPRRGWGWGAAAPAWNDAPFDAAPLSRDEEIDLLKNQAQELQAALQNITQRLSALQDED